jgi:hypothetical protein
LLFFLPVPTQSFEYFAVVKIVDLIGHITSTVLYEAMLWIMIRRHRAQYAIILHDKSLAVCAQGFLMKVDYLFLKRKEYKESNHPHHPHNPITPLTPPSSPSPASPS